MKYLIYENFLLKKNIYVTLPKNEIWTSVNKEYNLIYLCKNNKGKNECPKSETIDSVIDKIDIYCV